MPTSYPYGGASDLVLAGVGWSESSPPLKLVPPFRQRLDFAVGDAAFEHPEAAVGVDELHAAGADAAVQRSQVAGAAEGAAAFFMDTPV